MAARDVTRVLSVPGQLCIAPTTSLITTAFPYGGTQLGYVGSVACEVNVTQEPIVAEEFGEETVELVEVVGTAVLAVTLRQWDSDALQRIFPESTAASTDSERIIEFPGTTIRSGRLLASTGIVLLFSPHDPRNPGLLCYRAVPALAPTTQLRWALNSPLEVPAVFYLLRNASNKAFTVARLEDMTLP